MNILIQTFRHLYKTGVSTDALKRMRLVGNETEIEEQIDFEELKDFHDHSKVRHQRKHETKQSFRRRMRKIMKEARRAGNDFFSFFFDKKFFQVIFVSF